MSGLLDTSGYVENPGPIAEPEGLRWSDLSPFEQGYIEALFRSLAQPYILVSDNPNDVRLAGFSDLAPEALAAIRKDCGAFVSDRSQGWFVWKGEPRIAHGARFWRDRHAGLLPPWKAVSPSLGDDGKVRLFPAESTLSDFGDSRTAVPATDTQSK